MRVRYLTLPVLLLAVAGCASTSARPSVAEPMLSADAESYTLDSTSDAALRIDGYLTALEAMGFSGAIIAEQRGRVVLRKGYGLADRETRRPYTAATVQSMGSITKQITAAAILLLEERGTLRIGDSIGRYLADVPADKRGITLHHLLTHQSGMPEYLGRDAEPIDAGQYLARAMSTPLVFEPGSQLGYSNPGFSLLGIIIERVTGQSYERFIREQLLLPAGLQRTGYVMVSRPDNLLAAGYRNGEPYSRGHEHWLADGPGWNLRANGGLLTTVDDMHHWLREVRGDGTLSSRIVERWTGTQVELNEEVALGYGWMIHRTELGRVIAGTGGNPAFASAFNWFPEREFFYYVQGNTSLWPASEMESSLARAAFDPEFRLPPTVVAISSARPRISAERTGSYGTAGGTVHLSADDVRLRARLSGQPVLDAVLRHEPLLRARLARINTRAARVVEQLTAGDEDAFAGLVAEGTEAAAPGRRVLQLLARRGEVQSLTLVGSVPNISGTRFADQGGITTFVRANYEGDTRILSLIWREDGTYLGAALGPLSDVPGFVLIPIGDAEYTAVEQEHPWRTQRFAFEQNCVIVDDVRACRE